MKCFKFTDALLEKVENVLVILILTVMISMAFLQVILRNFFSTSIAWGDVLLRHLVLWIGFLGASLATREGKHINIDVLGRLLPARWKQVSQVIVNLFSAIVCFFLMRASIGFIAMEKESATTLFLNIPTWTFQIIIALGFGIMMFRFFVRALDDIAGGELKNGEGSS